MGLLGPKFWQIYRKDGMARALLRGKIYKPTHEKGGYEEELVRLVGTDEFGNRYYEDFSHSNKNTRRWIEYADYNKWFLTPKKIAPGWSGWLCYMYDDPPKVSSPSSSSTQLTISVERQLRRAILQIPQNSCV